MARKKPTTAVPPVETPTPTNSPSPSPSPDLEQDGQPAAVYEIDGEDEDDAEDTGKASAQRKAARSARAAIMAQVTRELNQIHAVATVGGGVYIFTKKPAETGGTTFVLQTESDLHLKYRNKRVRLPKVGNGGRVAYDVVSKSKIWIEHPQRRDIDDLVFRPGQDVPDNLHNLWEGWGVVPVHDNGEGCKLIRRHCFEVLFGADETLFRWGMAWFAQMLQEPANKPGTGIVFRSDEGTGKGIFFNGVLGKILGSAYTLVNQKRYLVGNFNSVLQGKLCCIADEPPFAGDRETAATLRSFMTEPTVYIELKKKEPYNIANPVRVVFLSNLDWVVEASKTARRFCVADVSNRYMGDRDYFDALKAEIDNGGVESFFGWLLDYNIKGVDLRSPPVTQALVDQKIHSLDSVAAWWHDRLWSGELHGTDDSLAEGVWPTTISKQRMFASYQAYCRRRNVRYPASDAEIGKALKGWNIITKRLSEGGGRPWVYQLPELAEARGAFEAWIGGSLTWDGDPEQYDGCSDQDKAPGAVNLTGREVPNRPDEVDEQIPF